MLHQYSKIEHAIPTEMRLKDHSGAIIPLEDLKLENNMSDARCEVFSDNCLGRIPMQALGTFRHPRVLLDGLCVPLPQEATAQQVFGLARRPARQSLLVRPILCLR